MTGGFDSTARLWDAETGRPIGVPMMNRGFVWGVAFSPDGKRVVTTSGDLAEFWDVATTGDRFKGMGPGHGVLIVTPHHGGGIAGVAFSPDSRTIVTGGWDKTARLWDVEAGRPIGASLKHRGTVRAVAFSPDGKLVLTGCDDGLARLWEITPDETVRLSVPDADVDWRIPRDVGVAAFSPDGRILATGHNDGARLWKETSWRPLGELPTRDDDMAGTGVGRVVFSPDGRAILTIQGHPVSINYPDGRVVSRFQGESFRVWDVLMRRPINSRVPLVDPKVQGRSNGTFWLPPLSGQTARHLPR